MQKKINPLQGDYHSFSSQLITPLPTSRDDLCRDIFTLLKLRAAITDRVQFLILQLEKCNGD